jgi:hypothetical protein
VDLASSVIHPQSLNSNNIYTFVEIMLKPIIGILTFAALERILLTEYIRRRVLTYRRTKRAPARDLIKHLLGRDHHLRSSMEAEKKFLQSFFVDSTIAIRTPIPPTPRS